MNQSERAASGVRRSAGYGWCYPDGLRGLAGKAFAVMASTSLLVACATVSGLAPVSDRVPDSGVVDIRGIWNETGEIDAEGAELRGFDATQAVPPKKVRDSLLLYPAFAKEHRIQDTVTVECVIKKDGRAHDCEVTGGEAVFHDTVLDAIARWRWQPLTLAGTPTPVLVQLYAQFRIN